MRMKVNRLRTQHNAFEFSSFLFIITKLNSIDFLLHSDVIVTDTKHNLYYRCYHQSWVFDCTDLYTATGNRFTPRSAASPVRQVLLSRFRRL